MPMNESTARGVALLLYDEPLAHVLELKSVCDDVYRIRFHDRRDGRIHTVLEVAEVATWIDSLVAGRLLRPAYGVCEVCDRLHGDRDRSGELRSLCRSCLVELLEDGFGGDGA